MSRSSRSSGFTLIELIAVIVLIGVMMAIAVTRMDFMVPKYELRGTARAVAYHLKRARFRAASTGKDVYIKYNLAQGKYWMLVAFPKLEEGEELEPGELPDEYEYQEVMKKELPKGIRFVNVILGANQVYSNGTATIRVSPFGSSNHVIVNLQNKGEKKISLKVNGFTGAVSFFKGHRQADRILEDEGS
ncbi:MAG: prepilin-type N-terminal cleavage/methylation domain-containing protein [Planctomycetota bacterium]|nr:prepilin-type N-terminal cleavage/methylation domain-containing protein [Planctomycetota bacterium]